MLIKAEALYWKGNKGAAREWTVKAVEKNFERFNCNSKYIAKYLTNVDYLPEIDFNIGHIMRQKYVCMYLQPEIWTDMRRYNYSNSTMVLLMMVLLFILDLNAPIIYMNHIGV